MVEFPNSTADLLKQLDKKSLELEQMKREHDFAQALEAALERVRSVTLNMNKSEELFDVIQLILDQFTLLKINVESASFALNPYDSYDLDAWTAVPGALYPFRIFIPYFDHPSFNLPRDAKNKGLDSFTFCFNFEEKNQWLDHVYKHLHGVPEERKKHNYDAPGYTVATAARKHFALNIWNYTGVPFTAVELDVLRRFGNVFEQAYSRFLDLQNAEARVREAQIGNALEKIRSRSLTMHHTSELTDVIQTVNQQFKELHVDISGGAFIVINKDLENGFYCWGAGGVGNYVKYVLIPYIDIPIYKNLDNGIKSGQSCFNEYFDVSQKRAFFQHLFRHAPFNETPVSRQEALLSNESGYVRSFVVFKNTSIFILNHEGKKFTDEENELLRQMGRVFEQAYTRFLDLEISEIQASLIKEERDRLEITLKELKATQAQLIQSEKMASLGELTAGIAHEIQNPLNFVNNFAELSVDLAKELKEEVEKLEISEKDKEYVNEIIGDLSQNQEKINHHGKRASDIVKGMLEHSRTSSGKKEPTDINSLCDEYLKLTYQSLRAKDKDFNAVLETNFHPTLPNIEIIPQDIGRVLINLISNAFYAVNERSKKGDAGYEPKVSINTQLTANTQLLIAVRDNGSGIPNAIKDKIFQPFFTTKPTGQGTGLGLSLSYDIVKAHGGELKVESVEGEGSEFIIKLSM